MFRKILTTVVLLGCVAVAQKTSDADKQKLIDIEQKFAAVPSFNSPEMTDVFQKYLYDGTTSVVVLFGHLYHGPKSDAVAATKKPDPNDPDVKSINKSSDFQVDIYGDTALVSYKGVSRESGHKNPALNAEYTLTCLDTFVKRKGQWYLIGASSVPAAPMSQAQWDAMKEMEQQAEAAKPIGWMWSMAAEGETNGKCVLNHRAVQRLERLLVSIVAPCRSHRLTAGKSLPKARGASIQA